ncbi:centrosomal protein of 95 kDa-like isoform X1 [Salvelinus fontinalis]|uniref:centrosomal protein of 95 kDa-like isoform X1 n=1 Tax=Salvelinus fontinalis TaxID=8038 RepID=UPI002485376F|nr:centrosomal protein of 95 kDa-like isoform X1 [Salvelinus fontinalis]
MGTQEDERDWVDVANDILSKCHINLRLRKVTDCNANVFVALYEAILGEKVPDYIAAPGSQEDDVHNIQSVIDSLALDYLQISLSHITGENIVRGDKESIKNLLEIFEGLLEYLTEQISEEESQNGDKEPNGVPVEDAPFPTGPVVPQTEEQMSLMERASQYSSVHSAVQSSSKPSLHSWNAEETGSTNELILLGDSAFTFTAKQEVEASSQALCPSTTGAPGTPGTQATLLREPLRSAIPLQPPYQTTPHRPDRAPGSGSQSPPANGLGSGAAVEQEAPAGTSQSPRPVADTVTNGVRSPAFNHSPVEREKSVSSQTKARLEEAKEQPEPTSVGPRRVLFRTQPDIHFLTLQDELEDRAPLDTEEEVEEETFTQQDSWAHRGQTGLSSSRVLEEEDCEEPLSWRRQRNRKAEQELHHMSEKLSRRLEELDLMLKRALGESGDPDEVKEVDKQSHHSDSVMECRRPPRRPTGTPRAPTSPCTRSLSPSPPRARRSLSGQLEGATREAVSGWVTQRHTAARTRRRQLRHLQPQHKHRQLEKAYEEELKVYEDRERAAMATERTRAHEAVREGEEREYREAILRDVPRAPKPSQVYTTAARHRSPRTRQPTPGRRRQDKTRRAPPMKVKDNDLLPLLLEEFPHLHLSPHALGRMWQQQLGQVDRLNASLSLDNQRQGPRTKLTSQVEEAQRRHNLLGEIIHKEQEHNRRLRDFKERIQQQKSTQNRLKEQRQQIARAKKYHGDYHVQLRARMMRARTKEERMFKQVFEEGLEVQKARLREQRAYAKEQRQEHQNKHRDQIQSMENYYKDQFSLLAETLAIERRDIQVRKKAQEKALQKMKRELRSKMEREIGELQEIIVQDDDDDYFHGLEVQRLRRRVQMASFQYNTSCLH